MKISRISDFLYYTCIWYFGIRLIAWYKYNILVYLKRGRSESLKVKWGDHSVYRFCKERHTYIDKYTDSIYTYKK